MPLSKENIITPLSCKRKMSMKDTDILNRLAESYFKGNINFSLEPKDIESMSWNWQQKFLDVTVNSQLIKRYPLSNAFSKLFFKKLIYYLENQEIHDDMYIHLCGSMTKEPSDSTFSYRHHIIGNDLSDIISIKETNKMVVDGTTGMRTWEAAIMLADWALCNMEIFSNKKLLELGSGVGFTGVTIAKLCAPQTIYLTDCHTRVLHTICDNIKINFPEVKEEENNDETVYRNSGQTIGVRLLDWNVIEHLPNGFVPDVVFGADIVYDPAIIQPLCDVLNMFFKRNKNLDVYIASVIRNKDTFQAFLDSLGALNFSYKELPLDESVFIEWDPNIAKCLLQINC